MSSLPPLPTLTPAYRADLIGRLAKKGRMWLLLPGFLLAFVGILRGHAFNAFSLSIILLVVTGSVWRTRRRRARFTQYSDVELQQCAGIGSLGGGTTQVPSATQVSAPASRKSWGCLTASIGVAVVLVILYVAADQVMGALIGQEMEREVHQKGRLIMLAAHPLATYQGCRYIGHDGLGQISDPTVRFDFDLAYKDNVLTQETYQLRFEVFVDRAFFVNRSIHHVEFGRDTGPVPPAMALEAARKLLEKYTK